MKRISAKRRRLLEEDERRLALLMQFRDDNMIVHDQDQSPPDDDTIGGNGIELERNEEPESVPQMDPFARSEETLENKDREQETEFDESSQFQLLNDPFEEDETQYDLQPVIPSDNTPLYLNSSVTVGQAMVAILYLVIHIGLGKKQIQMVLDLLDFMLPSQHNLPKTSYLFSKYFACVKGMKKAHYCKECAFVTGSQDCRKCKKKDLSFFLFSDPAALLFQKLQNEKEYHAMQYYRSQWKAIPNVISDVYDGLCYKTKGIGHLLHGYSLQMNWDGASKWASSKFSAWPIFLTILEMSPEDRIKPEHCLFPGLWFGSDAPSSNILFSLLVESMKKLEQGVPGIDYCNRQITIRARLIGSVMDLPARAKALRMMSHGGSGSCSYCKNVGKKENKRYCYPLTREFDNQLRDSHHFKRCYEYLHDHPEHVIHGLKGIPVFSRLDYWDMSLFHSIDIMHLMHGIFKTLVKLWTKAEYSSDGRPLISSEAWSRFSKLLEVQRLPRVFHRKMRSVEKYGKYFKAIEAYCFIMYMYPLLENFLPADKYMHHLKLVNGLKLLLSDSITQEQLNEAENLLLDYVIEFGKESCYGQMYVTLNVHNIRHLADQVRVHGPLWTTTCFHYESFNRIILKSIVGTYRVEKGISASLEMFQLMYRRVNCLNERTEAKLLQCLRRMGCKWVRDRQKHREEVSDNIFVFNRHKSSTATRKYKCMYHSGLFLESYDLVKQRSFNNSLIRLQDGSAGLLRSIVHSETTGWRLHLTSIVNGLESGAKSVPIDSVKNLLVGVRLGDQYILEDLPRYTRLLL